MASLLESAMLICFGFSWPINVTKAYRARTAKGMSLPFILLIISGYIAGIAAKFLNHTFNYVLAVYFLNLAIVSVNLFMYFRNVKLDKLAEESNSKTLNINEKSEKEEEVIMNTYSKDIENYTMLNNFAKQGGTVILGSGDDKYIPVSELAKAVAFDINAYNRSIDGITLSTAVELYKTVVSPLAPECVLLHLGVNDVDFFSRFPGRFDRDYRALLKHIKSENPKCQIGIISLENENDNEEIAQMNSQLKYIAESEKAHYFEINDNAVWSPSSLNSAYDYYYSTNYSSEKTLPVYNIAKIFYGKMINSNNQAVTTNNSEDKLAKSVG